MLVRLQLVACATIVDCGLFLFFIKNEEHDKDMPGNDQNKTRWNSRALKSRVRDHCQGADVTATDLKVNGCEGVIVVQCAFSGCNRVDDDLSTKWNF